MKKILALALVLAMMLTMFSFVTSATDATPEGTALTKESDFDTLVAGGKYYLANDIAMSGTATHVIPNGVTIDGCGYTVYIDGNKEMTAPLFELESLTKTEVVIDEETGNPVQVEQPVLDGEGNPVLDGEGNPVTELVDKTQEVDVAYETATTFKNVKLGSKGKLITFSKADAYHDSYSMTAPVFENNNTGVKVVFDNVDMLFYRPQVAEDAIGYVITLFWYIHGEATFVDCDLTASIASTPGQVGGFALNSDAVLTFDNCTVSGSIASTNKAAGFVKEITTLAAGDKITFVNCTNNATITSGGISAGFISDLLRGTFTMKDCVNNGNLTTGSNSGAFVGSVGSSSKMPIVTFDGLVNNGNITAAKHHVGGIIGTLGAGATTEVVVKNCENNGDIYQETAGGYVGGIIGNMGRYTTTIENCVNTGDIKAYTQFNGGIIGRVAKDAGISDWRYGLLTIKGCTNYGSIDSISDTGDLAGIISTVQGSNNLTQPAIRLLVIDCANYGAIGTKTTTSHRMAGGIMAITDQNPTHTEFVNNFVNCVNYGTLKGGSLGAGGILAYAQDSSYFENCVNVGEISAAKYAAGGILGFSSWRAGTTSNAACQIPGSDPAEYWCTEASRGIKAVNCINLADITANSAFPAGGMFGQVNATVRVEIDNCANYGDILGAANDAGGAFANHKGGDLIINRFVNYGNITGSQIVGGVMGWKTAGAATVTNCVNYGTVKGCHGVGGIMGEIVSGNIENCLNAGDVAPSSGNAEGIGGILGIFRTVTNEINIINCANIGTVTGTTKANVTYGCFTEGFGQIIGRVGGGSNGNDPYIADSGLVEGVFKFDDGDAIVPVIKLTGVIAAGAAQVNPEATLAPSEVVLGYKAGTSTPEYTITDGDALPEVRNNGLYGDNVQVAEGSTISNLTDAEAAVAALEAAFPTLNFKVVDGKVVVDTATTIRGYQVANDGKAIRFAATLDSAEAETAGFVYTLTYNGKTLVTDAKVEALNLMYAVKGSNGLSTELAAVHGGQFFNTITFKGVPATGTLVITVQATVDGVATGAVATVTIVDGVIA